MMRMMHVFTCVLIPLVIRNAMWIQNEYLLSRHTRKATAYRTLHAPVRQKFGSFMNNSRNAMREQVATRNKNGQAGTDLEYLLSRLPDPVFVTYGNHGYNSLLKNFVCNMALFPPMHQHMLIIVAENKTAEMITGISPEVTVWVSPSSLPDSYDFETAEYLRLMLHRGGVLIRLLALAQNQSKTIVWIEPDFHYTQNLLERPEITQQVSDLVLFWDFNNFCGCFIRFAPVPGALAFYVEIMRRMEQDHLAGGTTNDQKILNSVVAELLPNYTLFDRCLYRSGQSTKLRLIERNDTECMGVYPVAQHHNWIIGLQRKEDMAKQERGWFLAEAGGECGRRDLRLVVMTMNRAWSLDRLLKSLDQAHYPAHASVDLQVTVDRDYSQNVDQATMKLLQSWVWRHGIFEVKVWPTKVGLYGQWVDSWPAEQFPDNLYRAVILLEDDLEVSPHYFKWFVGAHEQYGGIEGIGAVTGQRPNLVAAIEGPPSVEAVVPKGIKAFGYMLMATWSLSPIPGVWREFRRWVHDKRTQEPEFIPSVPGIVPDQWYSHFRSKGEEENMWEMWFIRFVDERRLHTVYPWVNNGQETVVGNWKEAGLHFSGTPVLDFPICQTWDDMLLEQHPLALVGYNLEFPLMMVEPQLWKPHFTQELRSIMRDSCISEVCRILADPPLDVPTTLLQVGKRYEDRERHEHWAGPDVLDLTNVVIQPEGDVEICNPVRNEQTIIGSRGCKLEDPQAPGEALCILSKTLSTQEKVIIISQMWGAGYFHALVEGLPRLISAIGYLTSRQESPADWVVHGMIDSPLAPQLAEFFGVRELIRGQHYASRALLPFPTPCGGSLGGKNTRDLQGFIDRKLMWSVKPESRTLVIIKRQGSRALTNHDEILSTSRELWRAGDVIEHTGKESFLEQITLFHAASVVLGPHGAGLANAIAMRENTMMFEVIPESGNNRLNMCYAALAFTLKIEYFALRATGFDSEGTGILSIHDLKQLPIWQAMNKTTKA